MNYAKVLVNKLEDELPGLSEKLTHVGYKNTTIMGVSCLIIAFLFVYYYSTRNLQSTLFQIETVSKRRGKARNDPESDIDASFYSILRHGVVKKTENMSDQPSFLSPKIRTLDNSEPDEEDDELINFLGNLDFSKDELDMVKSYKTEGRSACFSRHF